MEKILVCVDDGLLKIRLNRILTEKSIKHEITSAPIRRNDLYKYSAMIVHSSYKITNLYKFIENLISNSLITVIYVTSNPTSNQFIKFKDNPNLILIDENKMDVEINVAINILEKLTNDLFKLRRQKEELEKKLNIEKLISKCKRVLVEKGYSEDTAHKEILKYAMDNKISKEEACKRLIKLNNYDYIDKK